MKRVKRWIRRILGGKQPAPQGFGYTRTDVEDAYQAGLATGKELGYAEGKSVGIDIAKRAATNTLKELVNGRS